MRKILILLISISYQLTFGQNEKQRLIVLADMGNEPDEVQQMVHMMMYANEFNIEGLIAVSGKYLHSAHHLPERTRLYPDLFHMIIDAYEKDLSNLKKHASGWPESDYLRSIVKSGQADYGVAGMGKGKSTEGSDWIIKSIEKDDPRPLYVVVNAGSNTLAQAIVDYEAHHSEEELHAFLGKIRVFENGAQDNAGAWICANYPEVHWVRSNYQTYCFGGPKKDGKLKKYEVGPYVWEPYEYSWLGQHHWALDHIMVNHGWLGMTWPLRQMNKGSIHFIEGGGTIPWLGLVHGGLADIDQPHWGGWSGRFTREKVRNEWSRHKDIQADEEKYGDFYLYTETSDSWVDPEIGTLYNNEFTPVWRWRRAMYNDFMCRMDWCVEDFENANHAPVAAINGDNEEKILLVTCKAGEKISFDASATTDSDGDNIEYNWWIYREPGTFSGRIEIPNANKTLVKIQIPKEAKGKEIHLVLEVKDDNKIASMYDYRRVVISVE